MADAGDDATLQTIRTLDRGEIERRLKASLEAALGRHRPGAERRPVAVTAADIVRLAAPLTSRN